VTQNIGHLLERTALLQQLAGQRVAKRMRAGMRQADAMIGIAHDTAYGIYANGNVMWGLAAHEDSWICCERPFEL
jgi:hypothetical protein